MQFPPVGYITVADAQQRIWEALHPGESQTVRTQLLESDTGELPASYGSACAYVREAENLLSRALSDGDLSAYAFADNSVILSVPPEYWTTDGARVVTLSHGTIDAAGSKSAGLRDCHGLPCFIDKTRFARWLAAAVPCEATAKAFNDAYWTYMMVLAWVYFGERAVVERVADSATNHRTFQQEQILPCGRKVMAETDAGPMTPLTLTILANYRREKRTTAPKTTCTEAREDILTRLRTGVLTCFGLENDTSDLRSIPALWWADAKVFEDGHGRMYAGPTDTFRAGATRWYGLRFERERVLCIWPDALGSPPAPKVDASADSLEQPSAPPKPTIEESKTTEINGPLPRSVGRPAEYDWNALQAEIVRIADLDGLPEKQSDLIDQLLQWCEDKWGRQPAVSAVKARVSEIYNRLGRGQKSKTRPN